MAELDLRTGESVDGVLHGERHLFRVSIRGSVVGPACPSLSRVRRLVDACDYIVVCGDNIGA